ncbi:hypothetical protein B0H13DRAFT_547951 [Mycena leptocephala]|nr:hypothetical protein B0H13DRAFT_547951 [Mycena leptocephala]
MNTATSAPSTMFPRRSVLRSPLRQPLNSIARPSFRPLQRPYSLPRPRPPSLGAKIWFRKDGTPRSKLRGLAITSLLGFAAVVSLATVGWQRANETYICLQRVDSEYATTDFSSFHAALQYFTNLCGPWLGSPQVFCRSLTLVTEHDEALRDAVHTILYDAGRRHTKSWSPWKRAMNCWWGAIPRNSGGY